MPIKLSDHFTCRRLLRFTFPSIIMMIIASVYSVVDGLFVANLIGDLALSAVNIVFPVSMILSSIGFMLGTGGCALVAKTLGEGNTKQANQFFSMIIYALILFGAVLTVVSICFIQPIVRLAGASELLMKDCIVYGVILLAGTVPFMLQVAMQSFLIVAEKPKMGLLLSVAAGITNMLLDYIFIAVLDLGIAGAGIATVCGYCVGGILPLLYFAKPNREGLRLTKTRFYRTEFFLSCANGTSELMSNLSASLVGILYNIQLMKLIGESGVAAHSVMMYVDFVFVAAFLGFSMGSAPIISFHYGAANHKELQNVFRKSIAIISVTCVGMVIVSEVLSRPLSAAFVGYNPQLLEMTVHGFRIFALCYFFCGMNIFASSFFTALCNGVVSAVISFVRSLLLRGGMVLLLPLLWGLDGVWGAVVAAEGLGATVSIVFLLCYRKRYQY